MLTGDEKLTCLNKEIGSSIKDFWSWAYSDLIRNINRGAFAEFIVLKALFFGEQQTFPDRETMSEFDLISPDGYRIEVKSAAYLQSWESRGGSKISFRIAPALALDGDGNYSIKSSFGRHSDVYVFCLWKAKNKEESILDMATWEFYVLQTKILNDRLGEQKTITLSSLRLLNPVVTDFYGLKKEVRKAGALCF